MHRMGGGKGTLPGIAQQEDQQQQHRSSSKSSAQERARRQIEESDEPDFVKSAKKLLLDMSGGAADLMRQSEAETQKAREQAPQEDRQNE